MRADKISELEAENRLTQRGYASRVKRFNSFQSQFQAALVVLCCGVMLVMTGSAHAASPIRDIVFATVDSQELKLDLYLPENKQNPPLLVFIHGGSWKGMSHKNCTTSWLTDYGFSVASISYRFSGKSPFPAQIHDCKAAVRWLRAHAEDYGYDATRVGVLGESAGGHLATLLGVTGGDMVAEGDVGGNIDRSSQVQAIVDYFGPMDFILRSQTQPEKTEVPDSPVYGLLGGPVKEREAMARTASPAFHVTGDDPPLLILHGDADQKVLLDQSQRIVSEYRKVGLEVSLEVVPNAGHGGKEFYTPAYRQKVAGFLRAHLLRPAE